MYRNNLVNFQASTTILNACTKKSGNLLKAPRTPCEDSYTGNILIDCHYLQEIKHYKANDLKDLLLNIKPEGILYFIQEIEKIVQIKK